MCVELGNIKGGGGTVLDKRTKKQEQGGVKTREKDVYKNAGRTDTDEGHGRVFRR